MVKRNLSLCHCCGKSQKHFASKKNFFEHLKSANHSEKNYNCDQCEETFQYNKGLLRHKNTVHEEKLFQCESCDQVFGREDNLKRHIKQKHETDIGGVSCMKCRGYAPVHRQKNHEFKLFC